jgi:UDP-N-acetylglucosamine transferase subunit ALG13
MILVTCGASQIPFDRLLEAVGRLDVDEEVLVQHGPSAVRPAGARCVNFLALDELTAAVRDARVVVSHSGVGTILLALSNGKQPCVVPRRRAFGETVDDHQLESARRFAAAGLVRLVEDPADLGAVLADGTADGSWTAAGGELSLVTELRGYIATAVGR